MNFNIRGENIEVTVALRDYIEKKVSKITKYFSENLKANAHVNIKVNKQNKHKVEITIPLKELVLRAEETTEDMYASIDLVVNKLERQIRKYKTKVNRKSREKGNIKDMFLELVEQDDVHAEEENNENEIEVVRSKRLNLKPMDVEEAILQMDLSDHDFFVFLDGETEVTNIVYKRKDGKYGLIETK